MGKSVKLGSIAGISVQVHWTFLLIVGWVMLTSWLAGMAWLGVVVNAAFIIVLFGCVLLHELGHSLAARYQVHWTEQCPFQVGRVLRRPR